MKPVRYKKTRMFVLLLVVLAVAAFGILHLPVFGKLPGSAEQTRFAHSQNYRDGVFRNQIETPVLTTRDSEFSLWWKTLSAPKGQARPPVPLPAIRADLRTLPADQDLAVWLGHSSYYIQLAGRRILIDPVFSDHASPVPGVVSAFAGTNLYHAAEMPPIDVLIISHDHYDHLDYSTVKALREQVRNVVVPLGVAEDFMAWGYAPGLVHEADWYEDVRIDERLTIHVTPARHYSGRTLARNRTLWAGFVLEAPQRRLFLSGDSGYGPHFAEIGRRFGPFDWAALDSGQYDPRWANVHMNPEQAAQAAIDLGVKALTPEHVGRFSLAPYDWDDPFRRTVAASRGRPYALWTPMIGQPLYFDQRPQRFEHWWEGGAGVLMP